MRLLAMAIVGLALASPMAAQAPAAEARVRQTVQAFYAAFNSHGFDRAAEFTTDDWNHINPLGGRTSGREVVLKELRAVHSTFLKHVSDTIDQMDVRFAMADHAGPQHHRDATARIVGSASQCTPPINPRTGLMIRNAMNDDPRQTAATTPNNCGSGADEMNPAA